jgi:hypothetical protein
MTSYVLQGLDSTIRGLRDLGSTVLSFFLTCAMTKTCTKTGVIYTFLFGTPIKSLNLTTVYIKLLEKEGNELANLVSSAIFVFFFFSKRIYCNAYDVRPGMCRGARSGSWAEQRRRSSSRILFVPGAAGSRGRLVAATACFLLALLLLQVRPATATPTPPRAFFVFGDSLVDNGKNVLMYAHARRREVGAH